MLMMETRVAMIRYCWALWVLLPVIWGDIVYENDIIKPEEIFDLKVALDSEVVSTATNTTMYYCVIRSLWSKTNQPAKFPPLARWGEPVIFSHTSQFAPFLKNRKSPKGVSVVATSGYSTTFQSDLVQAGGLVNDYVVGKGFYIDKKDTFGKNFAYVGPIKVDPAHPFLSGIASIQPSPDWVSLFYMLDTVDQYNLRLWDKFRIQTYPWDIGVDSGTNYNAPDDTTDPAENVQRITLANAPEGNIFVSADGSTVPPVAEWECILHTCPLEEPDCTKADFPPANGCDVLKYPECDKECDPQNKTDVPCQQCKPIEGVDGNSAYFPDCCAAGRDPMNGPSCNGESGTTALTGVTLALLVSSLLAFALA